MGPHADFACLSKKCATEGGATVYDLPVAATRCPVCGSKRVQRLYNAINVGSAEARAHDKILQSSSLPAQHDAAREQARAAAAVQKDDSPVRKFGGAVGLGAVQASPGAALHSRGGFDQRGQRIIGSVDVIRSLGKPVPGAVRE